MTTERFPKLSPQRLKRFVVVGMVINVLLWVGIDLIGYWSGRTGRPLGLIMPAELPLVAAVLVVDLLLVGLAIIGFAKKTLLLPLVALLVVFSCWTYRPLFFRPSTFLYGFRTYVYRHVPAEKLHEIALAASRIAQSPERLDALRKNADIDWDRGRGITFWPELKASDEFTRMVDDAYVDMRDGCLELTWGGALTGHWGLRIYVKGEPTRDKSDAIYWRPDPNIVFFKGIY